MMVDISHVSDKTFLGRAGGEQGADLRLAFRVARALANAPRNMTDEMIAALAKKGGVVESTSIADSFRRLSG